jgi:RNA polymerase sigma-70 factor (ECF subfamily)
VRSASQVLTLARAGGVPVEPLSDEAIVAACAVGDGAALGVLFDRYHAALHRFIGRRAGADADDLDDLVQLTFEAVPRAARSYDRRAAVKTWLFGIANNVVRHHVRTEIRRKRLVESAAQAPRPDPVDSAAAVLDRERALRLASAVAELPDRLREAFVLVYVEGVPGAEVAKLVGAREGTIWKRLHQARAMLRDAIGGAS